MEIQTRQSGCRDAQAGGLNAAALISIRGALDMLNGSLNKDETRSTISLCHGDPSSFPRFRTTPLAEDAVVEAVRSAKFNCYAPSIGILPARRAIAEHLSRNLSYQLTPNDVYLTVGCNHAIEVVISVIARPGANILLPRPGYPTYEARSAFSNLEVRHFDLIPEKGWEVDLEAVEGLADGNTVAMVIVNPGNPCGNVLSYEHLKKIAETAQKLGIFVIADEVYGHLVFGEKPFVPMAEFASIVPVITLGSISKRWIVPGWRLGWLVTNDREGVLRRTGIVDSIKRYLNISSFPTTFTQAAIPQILEKTKEDFFLCITNAMGEAADLFFRKIKEVPCITCLQKPEGAMSVMVKLNLSLLEGIIDDVDFCVKLAGEEAVLILPGITVGLKNWLRVTFATEPNSLAEGIDRIKDFCQRYAKKH